jgi:hypothetical protein
MHATTLEDKALTVVSVLHGALFSFFSLRVLKRGTVLGIVAVSRVNGFLPSPSRST